MVCKYLSTPLPILVRCQQTTSIARPFDCAPHQFSNLYARNTPDSDRYLRDFKCPVSQTLLASHAVLPLTDFYSKFYSRLPQANFYGDLDQKFTRLFENFFDTLKFALFSISIEDPEILFYRANLMYFCEQYRSQRCDQDHFVLNHREYRSLLLNYYPEGKTPSVIAMGLSSERDNEMEFKTDKSLVWMADQFRLLLTHFFHFWINQHRKSLNSSRSGTSPLRIDDLHGNPYVLFVNLSPELQDYLYPYAGDLFAIGQVHEHLLGCSPIADIPLSTQTVDDVSLQVSSHKSSLAQSSSYLDLSHILDRCAQIAERLKTQPVHQEVPHLLAAIAHSLDQPTYSPKSVLHLQEMCRALMMVVSLTSPTIFDSNTLNSQVARHLIPDHYDFTFVPWGLSGFSEIAGILHQIFDHFGCEDKRLPAVNAFYEVIQIFKAQQFPIVSIPAVSVSTQTQGRSKVMALLIDPLPSLPYHPYYHPLASETLLSTVKSALAQTEHLVLVLDIAATHPSTVLGPLGEQFHDALLSGQLSIMGVVGISKFYNPEKWFSCALLFVASYQPDISRIFKTSLSLCEPISLTTTCLMEAVLTDQHILNVHSRFAISCANALSFSELWSSFAATIPGSEAFRNHTWGPFFIITYPKDSYSFSTPEHPDISAKLGRGFRLSGVNLNNPNFYVDCDGNHILRLEFSSEIPSPESLSSIALAISREFAAKKSSLKRMA